VALWIVRLCAMVKCIFINNNGLYHSGSCMIGTIIDVRIVIECMITNHDWRENQIAKIEVMQLPPSTNQESSFEENENSPFQWNDRS